MKRAIKVTLCLLTGVCLLGIAGLNAKAFASSKNSGRSDLAKRAGGEIRIPFELANKTIFIQVQVAKKKPLWFVLDTGDKYAIIDLSIAKSLGLEFGDQVDVMGGGKDAIKGSFLKNSMFTVPGVEGFTQPLFIALPLERLAKLSGHEFAGILGFDFISKFVIDIDYLSSTLTLHDQATYKYEGRGESLPITFNSAGHPVVRAQVIDGAKSPTEGAFVLDLGSGQSVILNKHLVERERFLDSSRRTIPWLEGHGIGGGIDGVVGRIKSLKLGSFQIDNPIAVFSQANSGAFAGNDAQGNIGAAILEQFKIVLDYANSRIILEPNAQFGKPIEGNRSGLLLVASGDNYRTFTIESIADDSPASEAGLQVGDVLVSINKRPAGAQTLSNLRSMFQVLNECDLIVARGGKHLGVHLKLRSRI